MRLDEALDLNPMVTRKEAIAEIEIHGADLLEFFSECGEEREYEARTVLHWLGY